MDDGTITYFEDGSDSTGHCIPGALCDDAASRAWPEPDGVAQGADPLSIALAFMALWIGIAAIISAGWMLLHDYED